MSTSIPLGISRDVSLFEKNIDCLLAEVQVPSCNGMRYMSCIIDISSWSVVSLMSVTASCECHVADLARKVVGSCTIVELRSAKNSWGESCDTPIELVASIAHAGYFNDR
jgi:hypothetical protein